MDALKRQEMQQYFKEDSAAEDSGANMPRQEVLKAFAEMTLGLVAVFVDAEYTAGPRPGDRWALSYHKTVISSGTIGLRDHGEKSPPDDRYGITVTDLSTQRTYTETPLKAWIDTAFCDMLCARVGARPGQGVDRDLCLAKIPWRRVGIVYLAGKNNIQAVIVQHKSYVAAQARTTQKRKRLGGKRAKGPAAKRAALEPVPEPSPAPVACEPTTTSPVVWEGTDGPAQTILTLRRAATPPQEKGVDLRSRLPVDSPFREVFEQQAELSRLMAEQMAENAELAKTNRDYAAQLQQQLRAKQCIELEVSALRRCEREVEHKQTALRGLLASEQAKTMGMQARIGCLERELQSTKAVMRSMELEMAGLYRFLEEATRAAGRIANAYKTESHTSMEL